MFAASNPDLIVAQLATVSLVLGGLWRFVVWVRTAPIKPDPWGVEMEAFVQAEEATPICHRCLTPHSNVAWFCEHCGSAVGPYNNLMPFVCIFSQGEVFRNGVTDKLRVSPFLVTGYLLYSLVNYAVFEPIFWFFFFKNLQRLKTEKLNEASVTIA